MTLVKSVETHFNQQVAPGVIARRLRLLLTIGVVLCSTAVEAQAQYFGRNKVEYADFEFAVLETEHFDVYYYAREEAAARIAARLAERWYSRFSVLLDHKLSERQTLVLYGSQPEFGQTNVVSGLLSDTVGGVTESSRRRIVMPFAPTLSETNRVLGHELVHAFQFDIARRHGSISQPLWFIEGMAEYLARGGSDAEADLWRRDMASSRRVPLRDSDASRRLSPYQFGHAFWAYLAQRFGDEVVPKALKPAKRGSVKDRLKQATGLDLDELYAGWRESLMTTASAASAERRESGRFQGGASGKVQLGPSLSPDGKRVAFFSERDQFSLDLFLADVATGQIIRKLATTTASSRFDSLQPLRSVGAWSPDGRQFAFPAVHQGHAALVMLDPDASSRDRELEFAQLGQILTAAWSPDGRMLALSAIAGGLSNLYLYDLPAGTLRQLTDDVFADLHPAWSPDGREIAFASDRFSSDLETLRFGQPALASIDLSSQTVRHIEIPLEHASLTNPQWSGDGQHLHFLANSDGAASVFTLDMRDQAVHRLTDATAGITGLTPTSPAFSADQQGDVIAYTVYRDGRHRLEILDDVAARAGDGPGDAATAAYQSTTPSARTRADAVDNGRLAALLRDDRTGLPDASAVTARRYVPRLTLEHIGEPYLSSGGGALGSFIRAGGSLLFGDVLGGRRLGTAVQIANRMRDIAFETRFLNQEQRWNWGVLAELAPSVRRYRLNSMVDHNDQQALLRQADYRLRTQVRMAGLVAYPFSRGLRVELTGGVRHEQYRRDLRSRWSSLQTGRVLAEDRLESSGGDPTTVAELGAALVGDTTVFGATGPLLGSRFRLEVTPAAGGLTYTSLLADYRHYLMPVRPYTIALRLLHSGRYGHDGADSRLLPTFLGSRSLVRGHGWDARNCQPGGEGSWCGDELLANRMMVANLEVRVPVWGIRSGQVAYGVVPLDAFAFADGGMAWSPSRLGPSRISSVGFGIRTNAGGFPLEVSAVRALDGPTPGWSADVGFRTGF